MVFNHHLNYSSLFRYSNLILNLFSLMVDANIPDIALEPDKTVKKVKDCCYLHLIFYCVRKSHQNSHFLTHQYIVKTFSYQIQVTLKT